MPHATKIKVLRVVALVGLAVYLWSVQAMMGIRGEHLLLASIYLALVLKGGKAFRFLGLFLPVVLTGITYEYFRLLKGFRLEIHVADLYNAELAWFGIGGKVPADWFLNHTHPFLDLVCGLAYILYLFIPMVAAIALFFIDQRRMLHVGLAFLAANFIGMAIYLLYPAAPPWYVAQYGLGPARLDAIPSAAGAVRFDQLLGIDYFTTFYSRSANVFGAMPSLHVGYPTSTAFALAPLGRKWWLPVAIFVAVVGFAAVYLQHHYVWDVVAGLLVGATAGSSMKAVAARLVPARTASVAAEAPEEGKEAALA
ncbi:MAG: inositol phosphorylceramide synthase [Myxococcales bacterium]|nr:inositol phosphorylceramide synthase [Myxococcales bacterium]